MGLTKSQQDEWQNFSPRSRNMRGEGQPGVLPHHSNSLDLSPADIFQIPKVKEQLSDVTLNQGTFKSKLERAIRTIAIEELAAA
jgi:hypothetical protein